MKEIPLPKVFRGCWYGSVARLDSVRPIMPDAVRLIWLTKNYAICYQQLGYNGKWQLTFADGSVAERSRVSDERQSVKVLSADGANRAVLSGYLHFKARVIDSVNQTISIRTLDETSLLRCNVFPERSNVFPERNLMSVSAEVLIETDGSPFANITWHTFLSRGG
ncbi:MAG TPA: hypothetical protein VJN94_05815 [Candidatus Binataceae bacterium]|nr:hypothetical protein [Candidatus Binataceae bacterium]